MVRAVQYFAGFRGEHARGWLLQIVRNTAYGSRGLVRGGTTVALPEEGENPVPELTDPGDSPEAALLWREERRRVRQAIATLPLELREAIVLREIEELSYKEIAQIAEVPIGTVMSRLFRARRLLADAVAAAETR